MKYYKITCIVFHLEYGKIEKTFILCADDVKEALEEIHKKSMIIQTTKIVENGIIL